MKYTKISLLLALGLLHPLAAEPAKDSPANDQAQAETAKVEALQNHEEKSLELADKQDKLSADVQELIDEQTHPKVIQLLSEVEMLMGEAIERLEEQDTGGETIAIETEIVEKIYEAAKQKASDSP